MLNANPTAAHHLMASDASLIQTMYLMITKYPQNGSLKSISTFAAGADQQRKPKKTQFGQQWRSSIYLMFLFLSTTWNFLQFCSKTGQGYVQAK